MKRKIIIIVILMMVIITGCTKKEIKKGVKTIVESVPLMQFDKFKNISLDNIKEVNLIKYTEGGRDEEKITDKEEIKSIYNKLSNLKVGKEVTTSCEDNTKVYEFIMNDDKTINVEIECEWLVLGNKRYEIK